MIFVKCECFDLSTLLNRKMEYRPLFPRCRRNLQKNKWWRGYRVSEATRLHKLQADADQLWCNDSCSRMEIWRIRQGRCRKLQGMVAEERHLGQAGSTDIRRWNCRYIIINQICFVFKIYFMISKRFNFCAFPHFTLEKRKSGIAISAPGRPCKNENWKELYGLPFFNSAFMPQKDLPQKQLSLWIRRSLSRKSITISMQYSGKL